MKHQHKLWTFCHSSSNILAQRWNFTLMWSAQTTEVSVGELSKVGMIHPTCCGQHHARPLVMGRYVLQQIVATDWLDVFCWTEDCTAESSTLNASTTTTLSQLSTLKPLQHDSNSNSHYYMYHFCAVDYAGLTASFRLHVNIVYLLTYLLSAYTAFSHVLWVTASALSNCTLFIFQWLPLDLIVSTG